MVEGDFGVDPGVVERKTAQPVVDNCDGEQFAGFVDALEEFAAEKLDTHYGEYQPKHQAHQQHIENGWDGIHKGVHDNPHSLPPGYGSQRSKSP